MASHDDMVAFHVENQIEISIDKFDTKEEFALYLLHSFAYEKAASLAGGKVVLDLGCNVGYGSKILSSPAEKVIGVDVSEKAVQGARERFESDKMEFLQIDGKSLPFEDEMFDLVVSCQVIEHIVDYDQYIGEILRVLKPEGVVLFTTPNARIRLDPGMKPWYEFHVREFSASELEELLGKYFPGVKVFGLFAEEPIYSIELQRVTSILEYARAQAKPPGLKQRVKALLPDPLVKLISAIKNPKASRQEGGGVCQPFIDEALSKQFFYRDDERDSSLDLLAVCAKQGGVLEGMNAVICEKATLEKSFTGAPVES